MGLFEGFDVDIPDDVPDDPDALPDNTYHMRIKNVTVKQSTKNPTHANGGPNVGMTLVWEVMEGLFEGFPLPQYLDISPNADMRTKARLVKTMGAVGVPRDRIAGVEKDDLVDREALITTRQNGQYINVVDVKPYTEDVPSQFSDLGV